MEKVDGLAQRVMGCLCLKDPLAGTGIITWRPGPDMAMWRSRELLMCCSFSDNREKFFSQQGLIIQ
jgi:hypothetical protein